MSTEILKEQILSYSDFSNDELDLIVSKFVHKSYRQKEFFLKEGKIASEITFIVSGLVRSFYMRDGNEITTYLASDHGFISAYSSFITQTKSIESIQCIEDSETLSISREQMEKLYVELPKWQIIGRILAEHNYICMADRLMRLQSIPAKEKYMEFLSTSSKKIVERTPLIHVASFLGITPESLSRIRRTIS